MKTQTPYHGMKTGFPSEIENIKVKENFFSQLFNRIIVFLSVLTLDFGRYNGTRTEKWLHRHLLLFRHTFEKCRDELSALYEALLSRFKIH